MTVTNAAASSRRDRPLSLAELVDLEVQLAKDFDADPRDLAARDAAIGREIGAAELAASRHALLRAWLARTQGRAAASTGRRIESYYRLAGLAASATMLVSGAGTAAALLRYDGREPVNIMGFLAVLVFLQLFVLLLGLVSMAPAPWRRRVFRLTGLQELLRDLAHRRSGLLQSLERRGATGSRATAAIGRFASLQAVYAGVERWMLTKLTQRAGVAFNAGALAVCVYLITVSALAFAWSTTLEIDAERMTRWLGTLAAPWSFLSAAVPDRKLVEASRYFPGREYDPDRLGDWWPFLVAALVTYGLLPRVLLAAYASHRERRARAALSLDHGGLSLLRERLLRGATGWGPGAAEGSEVPAEADVQAGSVRAAAGVLEPGNVRVVVWADAAVTRADAERIVATAYGRELAGFETADGSGGREETEALARVAAADESGPVLVLVESWEPPSKSLQHFLRSLRSKLGPATPIVVGLIGAAGPAAHSAAADAAVWRRRIAQLADPRLRAEALAP